MNDLSLPGLLTCEQNHDREKLYADGYRWQSYQAYNEGRRYALDTGTDFNLDADRLVGISPGVWAVIYNVTQFHSVGKATAEIALELGADHLMMDVEECLKDTAPNGAQSIIDGCREGGWHGPVHLTTYGAPEKNPAGGYWDYAMDLFSFVDTGGFVLPQAYYSPATVSGRSPGYAAEDCVGYFCDQCGVPRDRTNLMIWPNGYNMIDVEIEHLQAAGLGPAFSVFLTETTTSEDLNALGTALASDLPPPQPEPEPPPVGQLIGSQHGITAMCNNWRTVWPSWTKQNRDPNNLSTWGSIDKLERTLLILAQDHDASFDV